MEKRNKTLESLRKEQAEKSIAVQRSIKQILEKEEMTYSEAMLALEDVLFQIKLTAHLDAIGRSMQNVQVEKMDEAMRRMVS